MKINIKEQRMSLSDNDIKNIISKLGEKVEFETDGAMIFRTFCHNAEGGKKKLYYYKKDKIFKCYTGGADCSAVFDIFDLIMKAKKTRGEEMTLPQAFEFAGITMDQYVLNTNIQDDLEYLRKLSFKISEEYLENEVEILDKNILNLFFVNKDGLKSWLDEGIELKTINKYQIKYDMIRNCIVIPNFNSEGDLIGLRGRFLNPEAPAKYMPLKISNVIYSHPTGKYLYGLYENKENIQKKQIAVIFEGEKSVLKMDSMYPDSNVGLATLGSSITLDQLDLLLKLNINEVVLAYDKEYNHNQKELEQAVQKYDRIVSILKPYFKVSILLDLDNQLNYKDSPIDQGKEVFDSLMKERKTR